MISEATEWAESVAAEFESDMDDYEDDPCEQCHEDRTGSDHPTMCEECAEMMEEDE